MSDFGTMDGISSKQSLSRLSSKTQVSIETPQKTEAVATVETPQELQKIEFEIEQADHAFALMTEIRTQIEKAYHDLTTEGQD